MRNILFKAKIKNWRELPTEEQWVYGYYVRGFNVYEEPIHIIFDPTTIFENNKTDGWDEIDPDTLCQYTGFGLNDNHDNKIWENDIVWIAGTDRAIVIFSEKHSGYILQPIGDFYFDSPMLVHNVDIIDNCIGNIFDNPELFGRRWRR